MLSIQVAARHQHMLCTSFDLPQVEPIANENVFQYNLNDRIKIVSSDFFKDPLPTADVIVMGNILHDWIEPTKEKLLKIAYDALPEGGAFIAIENVIDNDRSQNVFGLTMSLNMLIETGDGFEYTFDDFNKWASKAGFKSTTLLPLAGPSSAAIAYK